MFAIHRYLLSIALVGMSCAAPAQPREGVDVGQTSAFTKLVPAEQIERSAAQQYLALTQQAANAHALAPADSVQLQRLRAIANRLIPLSYPWNPRARDWRWEVNLIGSKQINAFCMPGGKIAFYTGILKTLQLTDDEVAIVMGHEMAHALREHARARMGKTEATQGVAVLGSVVAATVFGVNPHVANAVASSSANLLSLHYSRENESEADLVGLELAARAGFDPSAGVSLWKKMTSVSKGAPPSWLSTHPAGQDRIAAIEKNLPKVMPLYQRAIAARP